MPARDRHADLLRVLAVGAVCVGHWLAIGVTGSGAQVSGVNVLGELTWTHPVTWALQVMPLFFLVAGYVNAGSLDRHLAAGGDRRSWVVRRHGRLVVPSALLLAALVVVGAAAQTAGVDVEVVGEALWLSTVPLWFLAVYLIVLALAPITLAAHRRWGSVVPVVGLLAVGASDLARFHHGGAGPVDAVFVVAWLAVHQLGYAWRDRTLPVLAPRAALLTAAVGAGALAVLTVPGPYPVSMVRVPGGGLQNSEPPTLALMTLAVAQLGVAMAVRGPVTRWLARPRRVDPVAAANGVALSLFLWHMAAAAAVIAVVHGLADVRGPDIGSGAWITLRLPWLAACAAVLVPVAAAVAPVERSARDVPSGLPSPGGVGALLGPLGCAAATAGMLGLALAGSGTHGPLVLPLGSVLGIGGGAALVLAAQRVARAEPAPGRGVRAPAADPPVGCAAEQRRDR